MGNKEENIDASSPVKIEKKKKKKKSKNKVNDDVGDDNTHVEVNSDLSKEKAHKHTKKKKKPESNRDLDNGNLEDNGDIQKKHKKKRKRDSSENSQPKENDNDPKPKKEKKKSNEDGGDNGNLEDNGDLKKKKKRKKDSSENSQTKEDENVPKPNKEKKKSNEDGGDNDNLEENGDSKKKKKKKRKKDSFENSQSKENDNDPKPKKEKKKKKKSNENEDKDKDGGENSNLEDNGDIQKKKKKKRKKDSSENEEIKENSEKPKKKKTKKVTFSVEVEIFPPPKTKKTQNTKPTDNLVRGKRFTREEDEIVKQAVENYIVTHNLGDDGLSKILNCRSHKGMSKCWQEIRLCIPYRPQLAIYNRAHILFERSELRQWTPEEMKFLQESQKKHGNQWKLIAKDLGKHPLHVKDKWRRIKLSNMKRGRWSQEEYQGLYDLVNLDLQMKVNGQEKKSKHGMLRDNIPWTSISEKLLTRSDPTCCVKWYEHLTSSLVKEKKWLDADDYWLVGRLYEIDAACVEDVDWDRLLDHREGDVCRKRWNQMVACIGGDYRSKTFGEQVEILAKRYRPELAQVRQTWDDKEVVP